MTARLRHAVVGVLVLAAGVLGACRRTYVVVPRPSGGYRAIDTLRAVHRGQDVRVSFRFDTVTHTRTIVRTDTLWKEGTRIIRDTVRLVRRDTVRVVRRDTVRIASRVDTVRVGGGGGGGPMRQRVDTVRILGGGGPGRVDTVRAPGMVQLRTDTVIVRKFDTVYMAGGRDTVRIREYIRDTIRVTRTDTVVRTVTVRDTVRLPGKRVLFVPPGQYPPEGQCRVWVNDLPPGRQRDAAPCDQLGSIPAGAFVLFRGEAWDFDYDWLADPSAPSQIIALKKKGR